MLEHAAPHLLTALCSLIALLGVCSSVTVVLSLFHGWRSKKPRRVLPYVPVLAVSVVV